MVDLVAAFGAAFMRESTARAAAREETLALGRHLGLPDTDIQTVVAAWDSHYRSTGERVNERDIRSALNRAARGGLEWRP